MNNLDEAVAESDAATAAINHTTPPPPEWDRLLSACQKNDSTLVRQLIEDEGVDASHANRVGQSALHIAALWGHVDCVELLLEKGATPNATNQITGATPLHCAIQSSKASSEKRLRVCQLLIQTGSANAALGDFYGTIPHDYFTDADPSDPNDVQLKQLLQPELPPIFQALLEDNVEQVETILSNDPSQTETRHINKTPLLLVVERLLEATNGDDASNENADAATTSAAAAATRVSLLELLLTHGAQPNATTTVHRDGHLLPESTDQDDPPLHQVCAALRDAHRRNNNAQRLQSAAALLYLHGALVTPATTLLLHDAARRGLVAMVDFLLTTLMVDVNVKGRQGMTALQFAARSGKTIMVQHLLATASPDLTVADDLGQTAWQAAKANNKEEIVVLLEQYDAASSKQE
eukprot:CAMPEP_0119016694 /NCGR_PEP_ID=MMETSP1176-20130426/14145_1 /TAXON_ID=265551 /ORGANISM="Synedropsis recta cf, Strain CCMP1620" /LENGTH=407 /DNA_ID=CAMNT_0006970209 /DNA_START=53 /DNA_END=1276 /DNA_ORIENTATION=-